MLLLGVCFMLEEAICNPLAVDDYHGLFSLLLGDVTYFEVDPVVLGVLGAFN